MQRITYTNWLGKSLSFGKYAPFYLLSIDPNASTLSRITQDAVGAHGHRTYQSLYNGKVIPIEICISGVDGGKWSKSEFRRLWQEVSDVMLPHKKGLLTYTNSAGTYEITCQPQEWNNFEQKGRAFGVLKVRLISDEAFWRETIPKVYPLGQVIGGYRYPLAYPLNFGRWITQADIFNDSSEDIPLSITVKTEAPYIKLINESTGEFLQVDKALTASQMLIADTGECTVEIISMDMLGNEIAREYADYRITLDSTYFKLKPGINIIRIENGVIGTQAPTWIEFKVPRFSV